MPMRTDPFAIDPDIGARLIELAGTPAFAPLLLEAARRLSSADEIFAYSIRGSEPPNALASASVIAGFQGRVTSYSDRYFRHDPLIYRHRNASVGSGFCDRIRVTEIGPRDYREICFQRPSLVEKLSFGWRWQEKLIVLSYYSCTGNALESERLSALSGLVLGALNRRHSLLNNSELVTRLESRLAQAFPALTQREREVCSRTIAGWTSNEIADALGIGKASVLTYRQRAYARTGNTQAQGFLSALIT